MDKIILIGAGGHAKTIVDTIERNGEFEIAGFIDTRNTDKMIYRSYKVIGDDNDLKQFYRKGVSHAFVCIGFMGLPSVRRMVYSDLKAIGFQIPAIVDQSSVVASDAVIGEGTYIGRNAIVNADAKIGKMCIINSAAVIEHECIIGDFSHVAVGAVICGQTVIGEDVLVGANAALIQNIAIDNGCIVGAGAVVTRNLPGNCTVAGVPARVIK